NTMRFSNSDAVDSDASDSESNEDEEATNEIPHGVRLLSAPIRFGSGNVGGLYFGFDLAMFGLYLGELHIKQIRLINDDPKELAMFHKTSTSYWSTICFYLPLSSLAPLDNSSKLSSAIQANVGDNDIQFELTFRLPSKYAYHALKSV